MGFGVSDQLLDIRDRKLGAGDKHKRNRRNHCHRLECGRIERQFRTEALLDDKRRLRRDQQRVTVGRGTKDGFSADDISRTRAVLDDDRLTPHLRELVGNKPRQGIGDRARRNRGDDPDGPLWVVDIGGGRPDHGRSDRRRDGNKGNQSAGHGCLHNWPSKVRLSCRRGVKPS